MNPADRATLRKVTTDQLSRIKASTPSYRVRVYLLESNHGIQGWLNIRGSTAQTNAANRAKDRTANPSSPFKGVHWDGKTGRWSAGLMVMGKKIWLGRHRSELAAAMAYDRAALRHFGSYALPNFAVSPFTEHLVMLLRAQ